MPASIATDDQGPLRIRIDLLPRQAASLLAILKAHAGNQLHSAPDTATLIAWLITHLELTLTEIELAGDPPP